MIRSVLVPNRGEIAVRIARCCRELGIRSVLAQAEEDRNPFVERAFDEIVSLGSGRARQTYLDPGRIVDAARRSGCDAIHPGYGFLSERADLAAAAKDAQITFIGPDASVIERMGSKAESRRLMKQIGIPVIPGYDGEDQSDETLIAQAARVGFPLLVKASAGGGGKGMKRVLEPESLGPALDAARREARAAFGDDRLLLERHLEEPRHIEFQVFGDRQGNTIHLFERECSVQRRHQKIIEESPAPNYPESLRERMARSAVAAARGVGYENAGTVEFMVEGEDYFFLEMNTRLQVEHPVSEMVLGIDLVRAQIEIAGGAALPWTQDQLAQRGHAIECRIYAEDPDQEFLPQTGRIAGYREPSGPGVRVDSGVENGLEVSVAYDPLLAKLISFAATRESCRGRMLRALGEYVILGTRTNLSYLRRVIGHRAFREGLYSTRFVEEHANELAPPESWEALAVGAMLASLGPEQKRGRAAEAYRSSPIWESVGPWGRS